MTKQIHKPVLLEQVIDCLKPKKDESYLDLTAGYGGHAGAILNLTKNQDRAVLVDRDREATEYLRKHFPDSKVVQIDFVSALRQLVAQKQVFDLILADLGVSSAQLDETERGFSFRLSGPLDMRLDQTQAFDAATLVNSYAQDQLTKILQSFGEEPKAREIAKSIIAARPLETTQELAAITKKAWPGHSKVHPATRTFQAIRIAVNDELGQISAALPLILQALKPGGRLAIISFHSLEDRLVKQFLKEKAEGYEAELSIMTKKPLLATQKQIVSNPRARSAKLRAAVKINTKKKGKKGNLNAY